MPRPASGSSATLGRVRAVLYPAVAEAAKRAGAAAVGLIDIGRSAAGGTWVYPTTPGVVGDTHAWPNLDVDRVGITYGNGQSLGDPCSPVPLSSSVVGGRPIPARRIPEVVARVGVGRDSVEVLPAALAHVPADALPVVITTWALSRFPPERRRRFVDRLAEVAADRAVAWVSVEGVGVAPAVPTLGDRPASGHSIVGLALLDASGVHVEAVGRCWSRGRWMSWLAESSEGVA